MINLFQELIVCGKKLFFDLTHRRSDLTAHVVSEHLAYKHDLQYATYVFLSKNWKKSLGQTKYR